MLECCQTFQTEYTSLNADSNMMRNGKVHVFHQVSLLPALLHICAIISHQAIPF